MDIMSASDSEYVSSSVVELVNYEEHDDYWSLSPSNYCLYDQTVPSFALSFSDRSLSPLDGVDDMEGYNSGDETTTLQHLGFEFPFLDDSDERSKKHNEIPRPLKSSLDEKLLKALHCCIERFGGGTLAQIWFPVRNGDGFVLKTNDQPFIHDGTLSGYREVSRSFAFAAEPGTSSLLGLPGRVFTSKVPEWTSNVMYYNETEYLRVQHAIHHDVRGAIALPVFEDNLHEMSCCAVLELVTTEEKSNFDMELETICNALQAVDLSSRLPPWLSPQSFSSNQNAALVEIKHILSAICLAHQLPLALTWIPCSYTKNDDQNETVKLHVRGRSSTPNEITILCLEETTCHLNDANMEGFVHACANNSLEVGKGLVGKALQSNEPFFYHDVKEFHVSEYPLVHHARKHGLSAAVAIRLRSIYTGDDDYVLEFFLPVNMKGSDEHLLLLNNISETMERISGSLRTVSDTELLEESKSNALLQDCRIKNVSAAEFMRSPEMTNDDPSKQTMIGFRRQMEKKRTTTEKHVSLNVLQQHFSGSLKDAAKSLGVCPTTLKRICRQHGISRWPSRKIKKVDRSLKKIQSMLESVPGMEGGLEFDPTKGGLMAAISTTKFDKHNENNMAEQLDTLVRNYVTCEVIDVKREGLLSDIVVPHVGFGCSSLKIDEDDKMMINEGTRCRKLESSVVTDSSNRSGSVLMNGSPSSSRSIGEKSPVNGTKITVKATCRENKVRFKFEPAAGCAELYSEVAKRFELQMGEFQLKYADDDEEWVLLVTDSDLLECLDVLEFLNTSTVKFLVDVVPMRYSARGSFRSNRQENGGTKTKIDCLESTVRPGQRTC